MTRVPEDVQDFEDLALSLYLGPHLAGRSVLWVGSPGAAAVRTLKGAAGSVQVVEPSSGVRPRRSRADAANHSVGAPLRLPPGTFDLAVVTEIRQLGPQPRERLGELLRATAGGSVVVGARPRDDDAFGALDAELRAVFERVQWFGQGPVGGYALGRLDSATASAVVVDGSLLDPEATPSRLVAVSGSLADALDPYLLVTCPAAALAGEARPAAREEVESLERTLADRARELASLQAQLVRSEEQEASRRARVEKELADARRTLDQLTAAGPARVEADLEALEAKLREAGHRALELEAEVERRGRLLRDVMEAPPSRSQGAHRAEEALRRAVRAEAEKAAAQFENDELRARLLDADPDRVRALEAIEADLRGRVRGLGARFAELEELHARTQAQLALVSADLEEARARERKLEARLVETREELELELVRARMAGTAEEQARDRRSELEERLAELTLSEKRLSERVSSLSGQLMAAQELQRLAESVRRAAPREPEPVAVGEAAEGAGSEALRRQQGEIVGLRARLGDREAALTALRARGQGAAAPSAGATGATEMQGLVHELERRSLERNELVAAIAARDGLVTRLQIELAEVERRGESRDDRYAELAEENERLRAAVLDASASMDALDASRDRASELEGQLIAARAVGVEIDVLTGRLERAEQEKRAAIEALQETRRILATADLSGEVRVSGATGITAVDEEAPEGGAPGGWGRGGEPSERPAGGLGGDTETLLRSLTAQLEERNDRIRALERRLSEQGGEASAAASDSQRALELEERVARLGADLDNERAARAAAERAARAAAERATSADRADVLQKELDAQREKLDVMRGRAETFERDVDSLRSVCAQTRHGLEALLGTATASGNPQMAERLGALLSVLARY